VTSLSPKRISLETWFRALNETQVHRFKDVFEILKQPNEGKFQQVLSLTNKGIIERDISSNEGQLAESYDNYQMVQIGDYVLNPMDLLSGWVARSHFEGVISNAYFVFRLRSGSTARKSNPVFYERVLQSYYMNGILEPFGKGVGRPENGGGRWTLNSETLGTIPLPNFPLEQQDLIVDFLDHELANIDTLIYKQQRMIQKLGERKTSLIKTHVLGGMESIESETSSTYPWLKGLPAGWPITKISREFKLTLGKTLNAQTNTGELIAPYVRAGNIQDFGLDLTEIKTVGVTAKELKDLKLLAQDVVVVEGGAGYGRSDIVKTNLDGWVFQNHVIRARKIGEISPQYLDYYIKYLRSIGHFEKLSAYATIPSISSEALGQVPIPKLPLEVQANLVASLSKTLDKHDRLIAKSNELIEGLKSRRSALISSALIGKIGTRGFVNV
jgi:type I restriction enzyme S subunit